jgi:hypothetical protein
MQSHDPIPTCIARREYAGLSSGPERDFLIRSKRDVASAVSISGWARGCSWLIMAQL